MISTMTVEYHIENNCNHGGNNNNNDNSIVLPPVVPRCCTPNRAFIPLIPAFFDGNELCECMRFS